MKKSRFSVLSVITVLALGACASGCGSGVSGAPETFSESISDAVRDQPVASEGAVEEKGTGSEADSMVLRDEMKSYAGDAESPTPPPLEGAMKIDGPVPGADSNPSIEPAANAVDTTSEHADTDNPSISVSAQAPVMVYQPVDENEDFQVKGPSATANVYQKPEEVKVAPYASLTANYYSEPSTPKRPSTRVTCVLPGCP